MPVLVRVKGADYKLIHPSSNFSPIQIAGISKENVEVDTFNFYIGLLKN